MFGRRLGCCPGAFAFWGERVSLQIYWLAFVHQNLTTIQIQPIIDRIADQLPGWKVEVMTRASWAGKVIFTSLFVYLDMAMDLPNWALRAIDKIRRGFLWKGRKEARVGHCLIAWLIVCRSKELERSGYSWFKTCGWARMRRLWMHKTQPDKPWDQIHYTSSSLYQGSLLHRYYLGGGWWS